ncbi:precorrin-3B synthase [Pelagibacterium xiamenense]|uniref:precorrin-3B synthase n=1 Tax=Pelagibacterium xiamenense TaxID=2901140 RepID=UPI001E30C461|nr:precorrin-3B synthase [Pelagibacterium xiamenense]MCD7059638.1 precorrin-3B synthase [Pelagibacterium xiamenense]
MPTADGLLARFRPQGGALTPDQLAALAEAAESFGNGRIEITARGNFQVRGLKEDTVAPLRAAFDDAGIAAVAGVAIETSPIAGRDPKEGADPRPLAEALKPVCDAALARAPLSPKLAITILSGGQIRLDNLKSDIRLIAQSDDWVLEVGGQTLGQIDEADIPEALDVLLSRFQAHGPRTRGVDLDGPELRAALPHLRPATPVFTQPVYFALGPLALADGEPGLRIGVPFGQVKAGSLGTLADTLSDHGVTAIAPAPDRTLVLTGFDSAALQALSPAVAALGYWARPNAEGAMLTLCSGAEAGENGIIHAADVANAFLAMAPDLIDGSFHIHVSTCAKGCAYPGRPGLMLTGNRLILHGEGEENTLALLDPNAIEDAIAELAVSARTNRAANGTSLDSFRAL